MTKDEMGTEMDAAIESVAQAVRFSRERAARLYAESVAAEGDNPAATGERLYLGAVVDMPEERREGALILINKVTEATAAFALASHIYSVATDALFEYYGEALPELKPWRYNVKHDTLAATIVGRDKSA